MNIETQPLRINIANLSLEAPKDKSNRPFDPRVDVLESDKESMLRWVEHRWQTDIDILSQLALIDPSLRPTVLQLPMLESYVRDHMLTGYTDHYGHNLFMKLYYEGNPSPIAKTILRRKLSNALLKSMSDYEESLSIVNGSSILVYMQRIRALYPAHAEDILLNADQNMLLQKAQKQLVRHYLSTNPTNSLTISVYPLIRYASEEFFAKTVKQYPIDWRQVRKDLEIFRVAKHWNAFLTRAANLTQIVAEKIVITEHSFEIVLPEPTFTTEKSAPLPVLKNF